MHTSNSAGQFSHSPLGPLATAMSEVAQRAARNLYLSRERGLQFGEVTITEIALVTLVHAIKELRVSPTVDGKPESTTGADFEFWIEGRHGWFSYVMQAKKMKLEGDTRKRAGITTYDVGYEVGNAKKGKPKARQIDLLLENKAPTLYVLYNTPGMGPSRGFGKSLPNQNYVSQICESSLTFGMDGMTVVPGEAMLEAYKETQAKAARWNKRIANRSSGQPPHLTVGATKVATIDATPRSFPWSCLAACPSSSSCLSEFRYYGDLPTTKFAPGVDVKNDPAYLLANSMYHLQIHAVSQGYPDADLFVAPQYVRKIQRMVEAGILIEAPHYVTNRMQDDDLVRVEEAPEGSTSRYVVTLFLGDARQSTNAT